MGLLLALSGIHRQINANSLSNLLAPLLSDGSPKCCPNLLRQKFRFQTLSVYSAISTLLRTSIYIATDVKQGKLA